MLILLNIFFNKYNYDLLVLKQKLKLVYNSKEFFKIFNYSKISIYGIFKSKIY